MFRSIVVLSLAACTVDSRDGTVGRSGGTVENTAMSVSFEGGALPSRTRVSLVNLGPPLATQPDLGSVIEGEAHTMLWAIEPVSLALARPATLTLNLPPGTTDTTIFAVIDGTAVPLPTTVLDSIATATIPVLAPVFAAQSVVVVGPPATSPPTVPTAPTPPPTVPTPPPIPTPPPGTYPTAGDIWSCGTGAPVDLTTWTDTAVPTPATVASCGSGTEAHLNGVGYATLSAALQAAGDDALVQVCPGVHLGPFGVLPSGLTLEGHTTDPAATVLTGRLWGTVLFPTGDGLTLRNLTVRRGYADYEGGAINTAAPLTVENVAFEQNVACYSGGAILTHGPVDLLNSTFRDNKAGYQAGAAELGLVFDPSDARVEGCLFEGNQAGSESGALNAAGTGGTIEVLDSTFDGNQSGSTAGAVSVSSRGGGTIDVVNSTFHQNEAGDSAGALWVDGTGVTITVRDSTFTQNTSGYEAGAISNGSWDAHVLEIHGSHFEGNRAGYEAGALGLASWSPDDEVLVTTSTFIGNTAPSGSAVEISHWYGGNFEFDQVEFDAGGECAIAVNVQFASDPATVSFDNSTMPTEVCVGNNATVTVDGLLLP